MKVLLDTDFLINLLVPNEPNYKKAVVKKKLLEDVELVVLHLVTYEMATVLSRKFDQQFALSVLDGFFSIETTIMYLSQEQEARVWKEFRSYSKKNISFVDCANLVIAREFNAKIASFDSFYPQEIRV